MNVIVLDPELARIDLGPGEAIEARVFDIHDTAAIQAHEVMMPREFRVETRRGSGMAGFGHEAERNERTENPVNRHAGDLRQFAPNLTIKLLGCWMIISIQDRFENGTTLRCDREAALTMGLEKMVHSSLFVAGFHPRGWIDESNDKDMQVAF